MEVDADDPSNLFEEDEDNPERIAENIRNTEVSESGTRVAPPIKRVLKNPRLKFNPERLCGARGIPVLIDHFKGVKFKGKGHEVEDLDKLLATLEHWTHRLFPSMTFQDCLHHIEKLGKKRQVQTTLNKIRLDMPVFASDFVKDDEEDNVLRNDDPDPELPSNEDPFDRLIAESQDMLSTAEPVQNSFISTPVPKESSGHILGSSIGSGLTEEQKERMARNRMLAAERRKAKLAAQNASESVIGQETAAHGTPSLFDTLQLPNTSAKSSTDLSKAFDDMFEQSNMTADSVVMTSSKQEKNSVNEELELNDLMDLVENDESVPDTVGSSKDISNNDEESLQDFSKVNDDESSTLQNKTRLENNVNDDIGQKNITTSILEVTDMSENILEETIPIGVSNKRLRSVNSINFKDSTETQLEQDGKDLLNTFEESMQDVATKFNDYESSTLQNITHLENFSDDDVTQKNVTTLIPEVMVINENISEETIPEDVSENDLHLESSTSFKDSNEKQIEETLQVNSPNMLSSMGNSIVSGERKKDNEIIADELLGLESMMDLVDEE